MIFQSFLLGNLVSLCTKIINSVVVVGLYYGFLTTFSIGPSYLFLLRTQVMEEGEEGTENKVSATTGFIMGQLMMFISIYYTPLHLALGRPHTITVLALPYLLFHFFWNNHKHFFDYGSTSRNSMRNLSIQCVFLNNLIFQLFNYFILPSSMLARLVNIYMFRCNNKVLFVTSSFVGWLIGHILFMKWVGLVLVWIQQNHSIRSNKYLVSELRNSMARIFSILFFITCVYYLGRMPSPIFTKKLKETPETNESEEETDVEIEKTSETKETKQEEEGFTEEDPSPSLFSEEKEDPGKIKIDETEKIRVNGKDKTKDEFHLHLKEACSKNRPTSYSGNQDISKFEILKEENKNLFWFEKPLLFLLFDYKRWNRPTRYIKNNWFENAVRNEMSQYFFYTCQNDGKQRISFTYPPSLSIFCEMIQRKISLATTEKFLYNDELYNYWIYTNEQKKNSLSNEFAKRITVLDKGLVYRDVLDKKTRLCNNKKRGEYLQKMYDPLVNGSYRSVIKETLSPFINETTVKNLIDNIFINKIHSVLHNDSNDQEFEQKKDPFNKNSVSSKIRHFITLINQFDKESTFNQKNISFLSEHEQISSENPEIFFKFLIDTIIMDSFTQKIPKESIEIKEISKRIPYWSYKLIDEFEQDGSEYEKDMSEDHQLRSRKGKSVVIFTDNQENTDNLVPNIGDISEEADEVQLIRYAQQSDFRRDIIKGSMRAQRRKIVIWELFQANIHSPLFFDRIDKSSFFSGSGLIKRIFKNSMGKTPELQISDYTEKELKEEDKTKQNKRDEEKRQEKMRIEIDEAWDTIPGAQLIRGLMLITQSIVRKYIRLPLLIIAKNIGRLLLFQRPEWSDDFKEWNNEIHVKCTYNGIQLSETEFPKNWLIDGIQIKILFPFYLKPWHRSMIRPSHQDLIKKQNQKDDFCFLTVLGLETDLPFGPPRKRPSFFQPIFKQLEKKIRKLRKGRFQVRKRLKEKILFFLKLQNETNNWIIEILLGFKKIINKMSTVNPTRVFGLREESIERKKEKDSIIKNHMIHESSIQTQFLNWTNSSVIEKKMKDLANRTRIIKNKIEKISKENRKLKISPNKTGFGTKRFESPKTIGRILKRRNARLIGKSNSIWKFFKERIYVDIFLYIINIPRINTQLFLESTKNSIDKFLSKNKTNHESINKKNKKIIKFISTINKEFFHFITTSNINTNSKILSDFSFLSQAYVFYKLSQAKKFNLDKLRSVLQYRGISLFLKTEIKDFFGTQGIADSELKTKQLSNSGMNQWKNWLKLKNKYQYDLSQRKWSRLVPKKWRNRVTEHCEVANTNLEKHKKNSYKNFNYKKNFKNHLLLFPDQKYNLKKNYRYDVLSSKFVYSEDKTYSYGYSYEIPFQVNKNQEFSDTYNHNINKENFINMWWNTPIPNYLELKNIMDIEKNIDRKYLDLKILSFCLSKKVDIEAWVDINTSMDKNTKTELNNFQIVDKINKKGLFYRTIYQEMRQPDQKKKNFDWMGMNDEILSRPISNLEFWFFSEFVLFYNAYKMKPWVIPINLLFSNYNVSKRFSENKNINRKKKRNPFIPSNEKKSFELENWNQAEKELISQENLGFGVPENYDSVLSNRQKAIEENYIGLDMTKPRKKSGTEAEIFLFLKRYLLFQLKWDDSLNQKLINNIKVYCLVLRLINPIEILISSIERKELSMDIMPDFTTFPNSIIPGVFVIEPIRLSIKDDGQFIMYQTIGISLVHKSKHQKNQKRYSENVDKRFLGERDKNNFDLLAPENILSPRRRRELRILICLNSKNNNGVNTNPIENRVKNYSQFFNENKDHDREKNTLRKLKFFLWPNYRLEDLACMNRYWFDTNNGSRFSILRIHMYPQLKMNL
uniref:Protein TIC 214 n=1 Tax=Dysphania pumilio TaxID=434245 RepID=A0A411ATX0_9CARY|nr:Ycf1 [Dysphania pumilio]QAX91456.1 Ycf1 [Dysphania pumilio]